MTNPPPLCMILCRTGGSSLYMAAQNGHMEVVRLLLEGGADVNQVEKVCASVSVWRACKCLRCTRSVSYTSCCKNCQCR